MGAGEAAVAVLAGKFAEVRPHLDERAWRLYLGSEARAYAAGEGCGLAAAAAVVAGAAGVSRATVMAGAGELAGSSEPMPGRVRRPGAGRKKAEDAQPGLTEALRGVAEAATRGDPVAEITWCSLSLRELERQMALRGFRCGKDAVARMLRAEGYSLQGMAKVLEGKQHPDRDAQFRHINAQIAECLAAGLPVVSVDAKKKELIGAFGRPGRSWRPAGDPVRVRDHDFPDEQLGRIAPYGVYDIAANRGFVAVGTSRDTGAFAVNAIRLWWQREGSPRYPGAGRLVIICDAGGSNGWRCRLWKHELALLSEQTGLQIMVLHFPPGTSKWNKIEHRLFCHITRAWRARPLMTREDAVAGIAATVTARGLKCTAVLDEADYPDGVEISDQRMRYLEDRILERGSFRGEWNYAFRPVPRPAPQPGLPPPAEHTGPDAALLEALAALAGVPAPRDLHAAVAVAWHADRERHLALGRGGPRRRAPKKASTYLKLSDEAILVAAACRIRLGMTWALLGRLLGVHQSTLCVFAGNAVPVLGKHGITPAGRPRITTLAGLCEQAQAAGIGTASFGNLPEQEKCPKRGQRKTPDAPETANLKTDKSNLGGNCPRSWLPPGESHQQSHQPRRNRPRAA